MAGGQRVGAELVGRASRSANLIVWLQRRTGSASRRRLAFGEGRSPLRGSALVVEHVMGNAERSATRRASWMSCPAQQAPRRRRRAMVVELQVTPTTS